MADNCSQYVDGVAVHWYDDKTISPVVLDETHDMAPNKFMLYTEACSGKPIECSNEYINQFLL